MNVSPYLTINYEEFHKRTFIEIEKAKIYLRITAIYIECNFSIDKVSNTVKKSFIKDYSFKDLTSLFEEVIVEQKNRLGLSFVEEYTLTATIHFNYFVGNRLETYSQRTIIEGSIHCEYITGPIVTLRPPLLNEQVI